jgi:hypothetical protein
MLSHNILNKFYVVIRTNFDTSLNKTKTKKSVNPYLCPPVQNARLNEFLGKGNVRAGAAIFKNVYRPYYS